MSYADLLEGKSTQWALTREEMKNCAWVKPELVTQIELGEWDAGRSPETFSFRGLT